jgi:hypothetical protein
MARIRTLYEIYVTAGILAAYGRPGGAHADLAERYVRHREAFLPETAASLVASGMVEATAVLDADTLRAVDRQQAVLLRKYGKSFKSLWGWAAPLFKEGDRLSMHKLSALLEDGTAYLYEMSSNHVHGGSEGWHDNFVEREHETIMAAGPTNSGLALPAHLANTLLLALMQFSIPASIDKDGEKNDDGSFFLAGVRRLGAIADASVTAGQEHVDKLEREFQANLRNEGHLRE